MTTQVTEIDPKIVADWLDIAEAFKNRPEEDATSPAPPEAMVQLVTTVFGDALRELAEK